MPSLVSRSLNQAGRAEKGLDCGHQEVQPLASSPAERMEWKDSAQEQHESVNSLSNLVPEPSASVNPPPADSGPELNSAGGECVSKIPISEIRVEMFEDGESQQHEEQSAHQPEVETQGAQYSQQPETQGAQYSQQPETQGAQYSQQPETQGVQYIQQDIQGVQTIQYAQQPDSQENQYSHQPYNPGVQGQGGEYTHQQDIPQPTSQAQYPQQDFQPNQQSMVSVVYTSQCMWFKCSVFYSLVVIKILASATFNKVSRSIHNTVMGGDTTSKWGGGIEKICSLI